MCGEKSHLGKAHFSAEWLSTNLARSPFTNTYLPLFSKSFAMSYLFSQE